MSQLPKSLEIKQEQKNVLVKQLQILEKMLSQMEQTRDLLK